MKKLDQTELLKFLEVVVSNFREIKNIAQNRNKTTRIKAIMSIATIVEARADAALKYGKSGGYSELPLSIQQDMYIPILEYLTDEVSK
jgi:hypothetical protein